MIEDTSKMSGREIWQLVDEAQIKLGGNRRAKIYGRLDCKAPKRALENGTYQEARVLFSSEEEAISHGYRPCGRCLPKRYRLWKESQASSDEYSLEIAQEISGEEVEWQSR